MRKKWTVNLKMMRIVNMAMIALCGMYIGVELAASYTEPLRVQDISWTTLCIVLITTRMIDEVRDNE